MSILAVAQSLPNSDLESWIPYGSYEEPQFWNTPNQALSIINESTVFKSTDSYSGDYCAKLETKFIAGFTNVPGVLTLAEINVDLLAQTYSLDGGFALKENVAKLTGMYKYEGADNDSATVIIYNFTRDNEGEMDTIGFGVELLGNNSDWTLFTVNMDNLNNHIPDTFNVVLLSSGAELVTGSVLYIDSLAIETNTGIFSLDDDRITTKAYPNPSSDMIYFETKESDKNRSLRIYTASGIMITESDFGGNKTKINLSKYPIGVYTYAVLKSNRIISNGSFIKN